MLFRSTKIEPVANYDTFPDRLINSVLTEFMGEMGGTIESATDYLFNFFTHKNPPRRLVGFMWAAPGSE